MKLSLSIFSISLLFIVCVAKGTAFSSSQPDAYTSASEQAELTGNLIGRAKVKAQKISGQWNNFELIAAYSTSETLRRAGEMETCTRVAEAMESVRPQIERLTISEDGTITVKYKDGRSRTEKYTLSGSTMSVADKSINVKILGKQLQLTVPFGQISTREQKTILKHCEGLRTEGLYVGCVFSK